MGESRNATFCKIAQFHDGSSENFAQEFDIEKMLDEHQQTQEAERTKFIQATSQRSNSPMDLPALSFDMASNAYYNLSGHLVTHDTSGHMMPTQPGPNGYYTDCTYYPPPTTTMAGGSAMPMANGGSWGPRWVNQNGSRGNNRRSPTGNDDKGPVMNGGSTTPTKKSDIIYIKGNGMQKRGKNSGNGSFPGKHDKFHWVRQNNQQEAAKA